jgi:hypothetical protein
VLCCIQNAVENIRFEFGLHTQTLFFHCEQIEFSLQNVGSTSRLEQFLWHLSEWYQSHHLSYISLNTLEYLLRPLRQLVGLLMAVALCLQYLFNILYQIAVLHKNLKPFILVASNLASYQFTGL